MYQDDSFFTLSGSGQVGLVLLSVILTILTLLAARRGTLGRPLWLRLAIAGAVFVLFVWLSPQVYYSYYRAIIPGLPSQWVIQSSPDLFETIRLLLFQSKASLSDHGKGVLGWLIVLAVVLPRRFDRR